MIHPTNEPLTMNNLTQNNLTVNNRTRIVCTSGRLSCEAQRAWEKVCFYEHIATQPSLLLRTVLPVPQRTTGTYRKVGDVSRCMYSDGGYLAKTIRHIVDGQRIDFDVIEQSIRYAGRIELKGGTIQVDSHDDDTSSVRMLTRYEVRGVARLIPRFFIDHVVSAMHKIVIRDMQARLAPSPRPAFGTVHVMQSAQ
jgi:hypothetical protein